MVWRLLLDRKLNECTWLRAFTFRIFHGYEHYFTKHEFFVLSEFTGRRSFPWSFAIIYLYNSTLLRDNFPKQRADSSLLKKSPFPKFITTLLLFETGSRPCCRLRETDKCFPPNYLSYWILLLLPFYYCKKIDL